MRNIHKIIAFGLPLAALATYGITTNTVSADDGDTAQVGDTELDEQVTTMEEVEKHETTTTNE